MRWLEELLGSAVPPRTRAYRAFLLLMLVAASVYRVVLVFQFNPMEAISSDAARHWFTGTHPLDTGPMAAVDSVGYGAFLGVLAKLTVGSPLLVAYWTALLSLSGPWLWYRYLRELLPHRDGALLGWVLLSASPSWSAIYSFFMQETLFLPLLGAALWATWRCRRKQDLGSFLLATFAWILAGLTRGFSIPLAAVAMIWLWVSQDKKATKALLATGLLLAFLGPLAGRSWSIAHVISPHGMGVLGTLGHKAGVSGFSFDFSRRGGKETWKYYFESPSAFQEPFEPFSSWRNRRIGTVHFSIDMDAGIRDWRTAANSLPEWTLQRYAWLTSENLVYLFFGHSWPDTDWRRGVGQANRWLRWLWAPLTIVCLFVTARTWRTQRERLLPALLLTWLVVQGLLPLAFTEGRYRKPAEGLLIAQALLLAAGRRSATVATAGRTREPSISSSEEATGGIGR
jgi:hypothetical protein